MRYQFFDTANAYNRGEGEKAIGAALRPYKRSDYVLSTKVYFPMGDGVNDRGLSRKHIMEQCEASLRRLGTDYIDVYFCHRFDQDTTVEETLRALDDLTAQGKILYSAVSEWSAAPDLAGGWHQPQTEPAAARRQSADL